MSMQSLYPTNPRPRSAISSPNLTSPMKGAANASLAPAVTSTSSSWIVTQSTIKIGFLCKSLSKLRQAIGEFILRLTVPDCAAGFYLRVRTHGKIWFSKAQFDTMLAIFGEIEQTVHFLRLNAFQPLRWSKTQMTAHSVPQFLLLTWKYPHFPCSLSKSLPSIVLKASPVYRTVSVCM